MLAVPGGTSQPILGSPVPLTARLDQRTAVHDILHDAFADNNSVDWAVRSRAEHIDTLLHHSLGMAQRFGAFYLDSSQNVAVVYLLPDRKRLTGFELFSSLRMLMAVGVRRSLGLLKHEKYIYAQHPKEAPYIYLWYVGVRRSQQGKGLGSRALEELKTFSCEQQRPIYLETSSPRNRAFYKRAGFQLYHTWESGIMPFPLFHYRYPAD